MKMISKSLLSAALLSGAASVAYAEEPYTVGGNVALTSDYVFRGVSQTLEDPAIQGGFDLNHASGFYLGTWGSNIKFYDANDFNDGASLELDASIGFGNELASGMTYDVGYGYYMYPGSDENLNYDFGEFYVKLGYNILSLEYYYSPEFFGKTGGAHYVNLGASYELPQGFTLGGAVGYSDFDTTSGLTDYTDWKLFAGTSAMGLDFELAYSDTDLENSTIADGRAIFTVSKSF